VGKRVACVVKMYIRGLLYVGCRGDKGRQDVAASSRRVLALRVVISTVCGGGRLRGSSRDPGWLAVPEKGILENSRVDRGGVGRGVLEECKLLVDGAEKGVSRITMTYGGSLGLVIVKWGSGRWRGWGWYIDTRSSARAAVGMAASFSEMTVPRVYRHLVLTVREWRRPHWTDRERNRASQLGARRETSRPGAFQG